MADTVRTMPEILALLADNNTRQVSAQDLRDTIVSLAGVYGGLRFVDGTVSGTVTTTPQPMNPFVNEGEAMTPSGVLTSGGLQPVAADPATGIITVNTPGTYLVSMDGTLDVTVDKGFRFALRRDAGSGFLETKLMIRERIPVTGEWHAATSGELVLAAGDRLQIWASLDSGSATAAFLTGSFHVRRIF